MTSDFGTVKFEQPEEPKKRFTGWFIPAGIIRLFEDGDITMKEMVLLATIDSLVDREAGVGCYAGNVWLANKLKIKRPESVREMISKLKGLGLIRQISFNGRTRYLETTWNRISRKKPTRKT